jgi:predicted dehydrogenase
LVGVFDIRREVAKRVAGEFGARVFDDLSSLANHLDAAVVAVPTVDHAEVSCPLLERGIEVLVEKPIAASLEDADRILAAAAGRVLAVGHVEFFNPAVQRLLEIQGNPGFIEVHRLAAFTPRSLDVDVVLDLMIHDLQILHALDDSRVAEIRATGISVLSSRIDIANARIALESGCVANLTGSRVSADRVRKLRVFLPGQGYYSLDYQQQEIKGFRLEGDEGHREILPDNLGVESAEPLQRELDAFVRNCLGEKLPLVDGEQGKRALKTAFRVLEAVGQAP